MSCCDKSKDTPDSAANLASLDWLPQVVHGATSEDSFSALRNAMPLDDGVQRSFARPIIHQDGSIEYPVTGDTPPCDINGYLRDEANKWLFRPLWLPCYLRMSGVKPNKKTGEINVVMVCNNPQAAPFHKFVTAEDCLNCPVRAAQQRKDPA